MIRRPRPRVKLTRREVFARDGYTCQYCGRQTGDLTLDHVVPRHRGGAHTWDNLVTACKACNHRKGGKLLEEAKLRLSRAGRSSRAATSTRSSRPTCATSATRAGARTSSSATDRAGMTEWRARAAHASRSRRPSRRAAGDALAGGPCGLRRRRLPARRAAGPRGRRTGTSPPTPRRSASRRSSRARSTRTASGRWWCATRGASTRSRPSGATSRTRTTAAPTRRVRRVDRGGPGPARLHRQCHGLGRRGPASRPAFVDPHGGRDDLARRLLRAVGDPDRRFDEDALRMIRAVRLAASSTSRSKPATLAAIGRERRAGRATSPASASRRAAQAARGAARRRWACG